MNKIGIYKEWKGDYGFVDVEENAKKKGYYVHYKNKKDALDNDEVLFSVQVFRGKEEAKIIKILKRSTKLLVGKLDIVQANFWFVVFENKNFKEDVYISRKHLSSAKLWDIVAVSIISWKGKNPEGKIVQILGKKRTFKMDIDALALECWAQLNFPDEVLQEAKKTHYLSKKIKKRADLRKLFTFTIDGEDAKDLDDAISIKKLPNGNFKLFVHIADVAEYVREFSPLDREALRRGTSIYLPDRVIPMLPAEISNGVCSLNPNEEKLTLTCEMDIDKHGKTIGTRVYESIIESNFRLSYKQVEKIKENNFREKELWNILKDAYELKSIIEKYRNKNGYLSFDFDESFIEVDKNSLPIAIKKYEKYSSHKLIEHFMISANEAVAKKFHLLPFVYRVHPDPSDEDKETIIKLLSNYISLDINKTSIEYLIERTLDNKFLARLILRSLPKALYSPKNEGHFWLGLEYYSHFTSPIRRYPDLQIHRIIKEKLHGKITPKRILHYKNILKKVAEDSSERERDADKVERRVDDLMKVKYMSDKIGQVFEGKISGMIAKGFFVELEDTVEGFVDILSIGDEKEKKSLWDFYDAELKFKNIKTGKIFQFWEQVKVKLISADLESLRIDFELVEEG